MTIRLTLPWQWAERDDTGTPASADDGYYTRTRHALGWPLFHNWKFDCIGMDGYLPMLWSDGGRDWLDEYLALGGPLPDVWAAHIYGSSTVLGWLGRYEHLQAWLTTRRITRPVWITETNARGDVGAQEWLLRYLHARDDITAYWYASRDPFGDNAAANLHDAAGQLTHLGRVFAELHGPASLARRKAHLTHLPAVWG